MLAWQIIILIYLKSGLIVMYLHLKHGGERRRGVQIFTISLQICEFIGLGS